MSVDGEQGRDITGGEDASVPAPGQIDAPAGGSAAKKATKKSAKQSGAKPARAAPKKAARETAETSAKKAVAKPAKKPAQKPSKKTVETSAEPWPAAEPAAPNAQNFLPGADFGLMAENMAHLVDEGRKALAVSFGAPTPGESRSELAASVADATKTLGMVAEYWLAKPDRAAAAQAELYSGLTEIWQQTLRRYSGEEVAPVVASDPSDKRFAAPEWE